MFLCVFVFLSNVPQINTSDVAVMPEGGSGMRGTLGCQTQ